MAEPRQQAIREPLIFQLELPGIPKSLNQVGSRGGHFAFHREKKHWEGMLFIALNQAKVPRGLLSVDASAVLHPPTAHRRDTGNYRTMLEKALGDALQLGWLADDGPDFYAFNDLTFGEKAKAPGLTIVTLRVNP